jgi:hypothetical protein
MCFAIALGRPLARPGIAGVYGSPGNTGHLTVGHLGVNNQEHLV